ncbi:MAG: hypothetical protein LBI39_03690 [Puniceicoccales bacterium]|jgi:hypothetical protein|nr:hypothetical protein [Puniceicoccales bacterium]
MSSPSAAPGLPLFSFAFFRKEVVDQATAAVTDAHMLLNGIETSPELIKSIGEGKLGAAAQDILNRKISLSVKCLCWILVVLSFGIVYFVTKKRTNAAMATSGSKYVEIKAEAAKAMEDDSAFMHFAKSKLLLLADEIFEKLPAGQGFEIGQLDQNCPKINVPSEFWQMVLEKDKDDGRDFYKQIVLNIDEFLPDYDKHNPRSPIDVISHELFLQTLAANGLKLLTDTADFFQMKADTKKETVAAFSLLLIAISSVNSVAHINSTGDDFMRNKMRQFVYVKFVDDSAGNRACLFGKVDIDEHAKKLLTIAREKGSGTRSLEEVLRHIKGGEAAEVPLSEKNLRRYVAPRKLRSGVLLAVDQKQKNDGISRRLDNNSTVDEFLEKAICKIYPRFAFFVDSVRCGKDAKLLDIGVDIGVAQQFVDASFAIQDAAYELALPQNHTDAQRDACAEACEEAKAEFDEKLSKAQAVAEAARKLIASM